MPARLSVAARRLFQDSRDLMRGHDLALASAGAALYGGLCVVPSILVAVSLAQLVLGKDRLHGYAAGLVQALPSAVGADAAAQRLIDAGVKLSPLGVVIAIVMGSAYGEGLSRAFTRFAPAGSGAKPRALWLRATTLPLLGLAPLLLAGLLLVVPWLGQTAGRGSVAGTALASYVTLTLVWVLTWLPLTWTFRAVGPGRVSWRAAFCGALATGAFESGFLQGFLLFCSLPIDLGRPFGGLLGVGVACALMVWLWVLHAVVLVGYAFTWALHGLLYERGAPEVGELLATRPTEVPGGGRLVAGRG